MTLLDNSSEAQFISLRPLPSFFPSTCSHFEPESPGPLSISLLPPAEAEKQLGCYSAAPWANYSKEDKKAQGSSLYSKSSKGMLQLHSHTEAQNILHFWSKGPCTLFGEIRETLLCSVTHMLQAAHKFFCGFLLLTSASCTSHLSQRSNIQIISSTGASSVGFTPSLLSAASFANYQK